MSVLKTHQGESRPLRVLFATFQTKFISYTHNYTTRKHTNRFLAAVFLVLCGFIAAKGEYLVIGTDCCSVRYIKQKLSFLIDMKDNFPDCIFCVCLGFFSIVDSFMTFPVTFTLWTLCQLEACDLQVAKPPNNSKKMNREANYGTTISASLPLSNSCSSMSRMSLAQRFELWALFSA